MQEEEVKTTYVFVHRFVSGLRSPTMHLAAFVEYLVFVNDQEYDQHCVEIASHDVVLVRRRSTT